ncbi:MAG: hypothetical protein ACKOTZ_12910 [Chloroflexota bacterium]
MSAIATSSARVVALLLVLSVALAAPVTAATLVRSRVSVHLAPGGTAAYLYGVVRSGRDACVAGRSVTLQVSPTGTDGWLNADTTTTNGDGTWTLWAGVGEIGNGYYRVVAARRNAGGLDCRRAVSPVLFVD